MSRRRRFRSARLLAAAFALASTGLAVSACGQTTHPTASVTIDTFQFGPKRLQVKVGETVRWTNHDAIAHTVSSGTRTYDPTNSGLVTGTNKDGLFDKVLDGRGASASYTFTKAGSYHYFCDRHPGMEADIDVS